MKSLVYLLSIFCISCFANPDGRTIFQDDFTKGLNKWWVEGGQSVNTANGKLYVKADPKKFDKGKNGGVCTVWCRQKISGNIQIDFDVYVISSETDANNINLFLFYSDSSGKPLEESASSRKTGDYPLYHKLNGYIFTYLNDFKNLAGTKPGQPAKARFRIRRCPGFKLLTQTFAYHVKKGRKYHITVIRKNKELSIAVDGKVYLKAVDPKPFKSGYWGFRTYRTYLWFSNALIKQL